MSVAAAPTAVAQTVVLAAGFGSRLGSAESGVPKPLIDVAGKPLVAHALDQALAAGCAQAVIVIGHEGERVRDAVERLHSPLAITFVENRDPMFRGDSDKTYRKLFSRIVNFDRPTT